MQQNEINNRADSSVHTALLKKLKNLNSKVKKILLIQPIQIEEKLINLRIAKNKRYYAYPPYGPAIINSILKKHGYSSEILDLNIKTFQFIQRKNDPSHQEIEQNWKVILKEKLKNYNPDLVGIGCTFTMNHQNMTEAFQLVKEYNDKIITLAGGVHVSNATKTVLKDCNKIDFANTFEVEKSIIDFFDYINSRLNVEKLSQISFILDSEYYEINKRTFPDGKYLDIIPDYGDLPISELTDIGEIGTFRFWRPKNSRGSAVLSNKGCRARCSFCSVRNFNGKGVRAKSVETVIEEIKLLKENHGINHVTWLDDDLFYDTSRTIELFKKIKSSKLNITWDASNGIIASAVTAHPELMEAAEESGCIGAYFGLESGSKKILADIHKPSGLKHYHKLGEIMNNKHPKIFTRGFLIIGFPDETIEQIGETINMAKSINLDWYTVHNLTPLPSTEIYDQMVEAKLIEKDSLNLDKKRPGYMYSVRQSERLRNIEKTMQETNLNFMQLLDENKNYVPNKDELTELWFFADYEINYKRIFDLDDRNKLVKLEAFLTDISDRMTINNPLANYFLYIVKKKLNKKAEANERYTISKNLINSFDGWKKRFEMINISV